VPVRIPPIRSARDRTSAICFQRSCGSTSTARKGDRPYRIPEDNPFVDLEGARPEVWAYGFRNPWRMSFDRKRGDLWVGDVGWQLWEMIYRVEPGGNYGWAITEGPQPVLPEEKRGPTPILPPVVSHPHSEAASITGGFVYHGQELPELQGAYLYGDYQTGNVWGLRTDFQRESGEAAASGEEASAPSTGPATPRMQLGDEVVWHELLARTPLQLVAFAEDLDGELVLLDYQSGRPQIHRLVENPDDGRHVDFPRKLSETGLFLSVEDEQPAPGVIRYEINAPHWADHTSSQRWMAAPGTEPVRIARKGNWEFPDGSVLAKTVKIEMEQGVAVSLRRLETQILHREEGSWRPYTYRWNDAQTDAELVEADGAQVRLEIRDPQAPDGVREQVYRFSSRTECQMCHNPWVETGSTVFGVQSASPLAVSVPQLNREWDPRMTGNGGNEGGPVAAPGSGSASGNQLDWLKRQGWLAGEVPDEPGDAPRFSDPYEETAELEERVRSYLHINCAHCHQRHAGGTATIDLAYETPLEKSQMLDVRPVQGTFGLHDARIITPGDPLGSVLLYRMAKTGGGRMPRLGSSEVDEPAIALLHDWIAQLPSDGTDSPDRPRSDKLVNEDVLRSLDGASEQQLEETVQELTSSTRSAWELLHSIERGKLDAETRERVVTLAAQHPQPEVRDLFERFVPASERLERLGDVIDPDELLAIPGDAERGRAVFFQEGAGSCQSCHRVQGKGTSLGPDLSEIGKKYPPREMLTHLLEPSKFIEPKYVMYLLETTEGRIHSGLLIEENNREVRLKNVRNEEIRVPAEKVEQLLPQQKSLMPELLLRDLTPQQAADLLAYLTSLK
jgi:putative heme-binding domain-containing protein